MKPFRYFAGNWPSRPG